MAKSSSDASSAQFLLLFGPEEFIASRALQGLKKNFREADPNVTILEMEASEYARGDLASAASPSLFDEGRLLIYRGVEQSSDEFIEDALAFLENPTPGARVVFRHSGSSQRGKKLLEALRSAPNGIEVACNELKREGDRINFVRNEFKAGGRQITAAAAQALVDAFSGDLAELAAACSQLQVDSSAVIDEDVVIRYFGGRVETDAFKVVNAALEGNLGAALLLLRHALTGGADPVPLVAAITMKVRQLAKVFSAKGATASDLGMQPWQLEQARRALSGWSEAALVRAIQELARADAAVKGKERDSEFALERLITVIATKARVSGAA